MNDARCRITQLRASPAMHARLILLNTTAHYSCSFAFGTKEEEKKPTWRPVSSSHNELPLSERVDGQPYGIPMTLSKVFGLLLAGTTIKSPCPCCPLVFCHKGAPLPSDLGGSSACGKPSVQQFQHCAESVLCISLEDQLT